MKSIFKIFHFVIISTSFFFTLTASAYRGMETSFYIGNPMPYFSETEKLIKQQYPKAKLLFISTFGLGDPDPSCSQIGWQFVYQDDSTQLGIRRSFRHFSQADGKCRYVADSEFSVSHDDYAIPGYSPIESKISNVKTTFEEALHTASIEAKNGFYPQWVKLFIPLHPSASGKIFWNFIGPVNCNKGASAIIDAVTGKLASEFSNLPTCP